MKATLISFESYSMCDTQRLRNLGHFFLFKCFWDTLTGSLRNLSCFSRIL
jgi:hypothetical protein